MELLLGLFVLLFSAILHEIMHGWVANKLGDPTARIMGRLTLNPIPHIDPVMSIILPALLLFSGSPIIFGAAKPVPIDPRHFKDPKKDMAIVALAGPVTNLVLAVAAGLLFHLTSGIPILSNVLMLVVVYNLILCFINLIPIPPLDGSRVITAILPDDLARTYNSIERIGFFLVFFLLVFPLGSFSLSNLLDSLLYSSLKLLGLN